MILYRPMIELLQKTIDETIAQIPTIARLLRNENIPWSKLEIENESDFILGAIFFANTASIFVFFLNRPNRKPTLDEVLVIDSIILERAKGI